MNNRVHAAFAIAAGTLLLIGCEPIEDAANRGTEGGRLERLTQDMEGTRDKAAEVAREQGNRFLEEAELKLRQMREQLADARTREQITEEARDHFHAAAEQLEDDIERLEGELQRLREGGAEAWRELGPRIRGAMADLADSYERFKESHLERREESTGQPPEPGPQ